MAYYQQPKTAGAKQREQLPQSQDDMILCREDMSMQAPPKS